MLSGVGVRRVVAQIPGKLYPKHVHAADIFTLVRAGEVIDSGEEGRDPTVVVLFDDYWYEGMQRLMIAWQDGKVYLDPEHRNRRSLGR